MRRAKERLAIVVTVGALGLAGCDGGESEFHGEAKLLCKGKKGGKYTPGTDAFDKCVKETEDFLEQVESD
jgi:hypothetical protein